MARVNDVADNLNFPLSHIFHFRLSASRQGRGTRTPVRRRPIIQSSRGGVGRPSLSQFPILVGAGKRQIPRESDCAAARPPSVSSHATNEEGHRIVGISRSVRSWPRARPREGSHDFSLSPPQSGFGDS